MAMRNANVKNDPPAARTLIKPTMLPIRKIPIACSMPEVVKLNIFGILHFSKRIAIHLLTFEALCVSLVRKFFVGGFLMVETLTTEDFKEKIFNYEESQQWSYKGDLPCIIDFYADWCGPCKMVEPILEELAKEYEGKLKIYRVNTDQEQELAAVFGIRSIPSLLFVPLNDQPQMAVGALPKDAFKQAIREVLKVE